MNSFKKTKINMIGFGLVLGGVLGNLSDRILFGYVKDFLDFCHSNDFCFLSKVSNKAVTAAERTLSCTGNIISLALPCTSALSEKEATSLHAAKELFSFFKTCFNKMKGH